MNLQSTLVILGLSLVPGVTYALQAAPLPEPGVIELLAIAAVAGVAVALRKRRKK
jgi:hypothetical protein